MRAPDRSNCHRAAAPDCPAPLRDLRPGRGRCGPPGPARRNSSGSCGWIAAWDSRRNLSTAPCPAILRSRSAGPGTEIPDGRRPVAATARVAADGHERIGLAGWTCLNSLVADVTPLPRRWTAHDL